MYNFVASIVPANIQALFICIWFASTIMTKFQCDYLPMLGWKLIHVCKGDPRYLHVRGNSSDIGNKSIICYEDKSKISLGRLNSNTMVLSRITSVFDNGKG